MTENERLAAMIAALSPYLSDAVAKQSDDPVKRDLELTCSACGEVICDIEPDDTLDVLIRTFIDHVSHTLEVEA